MAKELTDQQKRFAAEYLVDLNATQAAIRAGYSEKTADSQASRLLRNVKVQEFIQKGNNKRMAKTELSAEYVINGLMEVHARCMNAEPVLDNEGNPTGEYRFEHSGANKSLELLGRHLKLFTDKAEIEHKGLPKYNMVLLNE